MPGVHLLPGAGVDGDEHRARLLTGFGAFHGRDVLRVPALTHLHGDGAGGVFDHFLHNTAAAVGVKHQLAARPARDDLGGRAAHVDVQKIERVLFHGGSGLPHDLGHLAKDLHAVGGTVGFGLEQADGFVVAVYQRPAGHHLTDGKTGSVLGHQPPGRGIGKARHGAEHCPVGQ